MKWREVLTFLGVTGLIIHENLVCFYWENSSFSSGHYAMATRMMITYGFISLLLSLAIHRELTGIFRHSWSIPIAYGALLLYAMIRAQHYSANMILGNFYRPIFGIACMLSSEYLLATDRNGRMKLMFNICIFGIFSFGTFAVIRELLWKKSSKGYDIVNSIYFLLPFIIYWSLKGIKKITKFIPALLVITSLFSLKRGAIIMSLAAWCAMEAFEREGRTAIKKVTSIILVLIVFGSIFHVVDTGFFNGHISKRFETIREGTGRAEQFAWTIDVLKHRSLDKTMFGYGYNASAVQYYGQFVHNDWLLIIFDFGLIGLFFYGCIHIALLAHFFRLQRQRSPYAKVWAACYTLCFCLSMYSNFIWLFCANILPVLGCILGYEYERTKATSEEILHTKKKWSFVAKQYRVLW